MQITKTLEVDFFDYDQLEKLQKLGIDCKNGIDVVISADYQPYEKQTLEHPGCEEYIDNTIVECGKIDITDVFTDFEIEEFEREMYDNLSDVDDDDWGDDWNE